MSTKERLARTETPVDQSTPPTRLASVRLIDDHNTAPWILASLVQEMHPESIMRPSHHGASSLGVDFTAVSGLPPHHTLRLKLGQKDHMIRLAEVFGQLVVNLVN